MWNLPSTCYQKERFQRLDEGFSSMSVIHLPPPPNSPAIMRMSYDSDCLGEPNFSENLYVIRNPVGWTRKIQTAAPVLSFTYTAQGDTIIHPEAHVDYIEFPRERSGQSLVLPNWTDMHFIPRTHETQPKLPSKTPAASACRFRSLSTCLSCFGTRKHSQPPKASLSQVIIAPDCDTSHHTSSYTSFANNTALPSEWSESSTITPTSKTPAASAKGSRLLGRFRHQTWQKSSSVSSVVEGGGCV